MKIKHTFLKLKEAADTRRGRLMKETIVYGLMAAIYTSLFFFGALYPKYGLPQQSVVYDEREEDTEETEETVVYKSLILERIKEWF